MRSGSSSLLPLSRRSRRDALTISICESARTNLCPWSENGGANRSLSASDWRLYAPTQPRHTERQGHSGDRRHRYAFVFAIILGFSLFALHAAVNVAFGAPAT